MYFYVKSNCCNLIASDIPIIIVFKLTFINILRSLFPFSAMGYQKEMILYDLYQIK